MICDVLAKQLKIRSRISGGESRSCHRSRSSSLARVGQHYNNAHNFFISLWSRSKKATQSLGNWGVSADANWMKCFTPTYSVVEKCAVDSVERYIFSNLCRHLIRKCQPKSIRFSIRSHCSFRTHSLIKSSKSVSSQKKWTGFRRVKVTSQIFNSAEILNNMGRLIFNGIFRTNSSGFFFDWHCAQRT